jgi:hypothetical protein
MLLSGFCGQAKKLKFAGWESEAWGMEHGDIFMRHPELPARPAGGVSGPHQSFNPSILQFK